MSKKGYSFFGFVFLKEWMRIPGCTGLVIGLAGKITFCKSTDFMEHILSSDSHDWFLLVEGQTEKIALFGCQVRAVLECTERAESPLDKDFYFVR